MSAAPQGVAHSSPVGMNMSPGSNPWLHNPGAVDQMFDFASFMWDAGDVLGQVSPGDGYAADSTDAFVSLTYQISYPFLAYSFSHVIRGS